MGLRARLQRAVDKDKQKIRKQHEWVEFAKQRADLDPLRNILPMSALKVMYKQSKNAHKRDRKNLASTEDGERTPIFKGKHSSFVELHRTIGLLELIEELEGYEQNYKEHDALEEFKKQWRVLRNQLVRRNTSSPLVTAVRNYKATGNILKSK